MCVGRTSASSTRGHRFEAVPERFREIASLCPVNDNRIPAIGAPPRLRDAAVSAAWRLVLATSSVGLVAAATCLLGLVQGDRPR
ncbi:hypothetical protein [Methylorubrum extorquens]|nr:hypothetical protein [Methylorubrum extorquens]EHP94785.1 hypothetical protein MetexDRAFT_0323 [Methylorubrum extorquens DSM 13060]